MIESWKLRLIDAIKKCEAITLNITMQGGECIYLRISPYQNELILDIARAVEEAFTREQPFDMIEYPGS